MKNDFQLLPLHLLAQAFNSQLQAELQQQLDQQRQIAQRGYERRVHQITQQLLAQTGEAGSDGVEEEAREIAGAFDAESITLDPKLEQDIRNRVRQEVLEAWMASEQVSSKLSWLPHQLFAYFGAWTAIKRGDLYSPQATFEHNVVRAKDRFALGSVLLAKAPRSLWFKDAPKGFQQYKSPINPLVPIILAAFKCYQGIPYEAWDKSEIGIFVDAEIEGLVGCKVPDLSNSEILALRNTAMMVKSGARAGKSNNPATSASLYHLQDTAIAHLPKLVKHMVLQTWAAHPQHRDPYAILDPENWDRMPEPLTGNDIFVPEQKITFKTTASATQDNWSC